MFVKMTTNNNKLQTNNNIQSYKLWEAVPNSFSDKELRKNFKFS